MMGKDESYFNVSLTAKDTESHSETVPVGTVTDHNFSKRGPSAHQPNALQTTTLKRDESGIKARSFCTPA